MGKMIADELDKGIVVCCYYSGHWCPPCKKFTELLVEFYNEANASGKVLEIIFCTTDKTEEEYEK
jgi:nucleoredoxin